MVEKPKTPRKKYLKKRKEGKGGKVLPGGRAFQRILQDRKARGLDEIDLEGAPVSDSLVIADEVVPGKRSKSSKTAKTRTKSKSKNTKPE